MRSNLRTLQSQRRVTNTTRSNLYGHILTSIFPWSDELFRIFVYFKTILKEMLDVTIVHQGRIGFNLECDL